MVSRPDFWWPEVFWMPEGGRALFDVVHEDEHGRPDGYVSYEIKGEWHGGVAEPRSCTCGTCRRPTPTTRAALWEFVFGVDLVVSIVRDEPPARRAAALPARRQPRSCAPTS